ncbi:MarR family transcriptional regulator [Gloeobacter kilaueensis JS1]|uniref:MarR family transcriptional regulator n=2 Tax=Gloeobacter TaxID=33071 RepID=U5QIA4_GLOK1|nr:MarR family transcriptional regulator [Gloeobacter kilaueensis JS1]
MAITEEQLVLLYQSVQQLIRSLKVAQPQGRGGGEGLNPTDQQALTLIGESGPCTLGEVAESLGVPLSTASSAVERLVQKGLVERSRVASNRRIVRLALTAAGKAMFAEVAREQLHQCQAMLEALDGPEREVFIALMAKIASRTAPAPTLRADL